MPRLVFAGGEHVATYPRRDALLESARSWISLADEHNAAAREAIAVGDEATAIIELAHAQSKTEMARKVLNEARSVEMGAA